MGGWLEGKAFLGGICHGVGLGGGAMQEGVCHGVGGRVGGVLTSHFQLSLLLHMVEHVISQLPAKATCCHASSAIMDLPSGTVGQNKHFPTSPFWSWCFFFLQQEKLTSTPSPQLTNVSCWGCEGLLLLRQLN